MLAKVDFAYSGFHDLLNIQQHCEQYGPLNRYRQGFAGTDKAEHVRIFAAINDSVHSFDNSQGKGLDKIYYAIDGKPVDLFLHAAEIQHLEDVANLIDFMHPFAISASLLWLVLAALFSSGKLPAPRFKQQLAGIGVFVGLCALTALLIGPEKVFNAFHEWVFPAGHQWYFFYEDSLMSTLMKAPDLFGAIAVLLTVVALVVFVVLNWLVSFSRPIHHLTHRLSRRHKD
ncbi:MAG: DUF1461 domain-containing protein [Algicola sp.]|nr:DUF1461 domain-containing protein [Algicola sp.]